MIKFKSIVAKVLAATVVIGLLPTNIALASDIENEKTEGANSRATYIGTTGMANKDILPPTWIPFEYINGDTAYCMQPSKDFPVNLTYYAAGDYHDNAAVKSVAYHGYPYNKSGLQQKYGLSNKQAQGMTQYVLWELMHPGFHQKHSNGYINELMSLAKAGNYPSSELKLSTTNPKMNRYQNLQVSDPISTSGNFTGTFTFPSNDDVYSVDANGKWKQTFNIGETFKIVAVASVKGNVTKNITVNMTQPTFSKFTPSNSKYQILSAPSMKNISTNKSVTINVPGIQLKGDVVVHKVNEVGTPLEGVEFGLYSDAEAKNKITSKKTDKDGKIKFDNLDINSKYYIKEIGGLSGYVVDSSIKSVVIGEQVQTIKVVNERIQGSIKIVKVASESNDKRLSGAKFEIRDGANKVVDTLVTDANGEAFSKKLPYGEYSVVETVAPVGYDKTDKITKVNIDSKDKVVEVKYENNVIVGKIKMVKVDSVDSNKKLAGAKFEIRDINNKVVDTLVTDANGEAVSKSLVYGTYRVIEIAAPVGYELGSQVIEAKVEKMNETLTYEYKNNVIKGAIKIVKVDSKNTDKRLAGAKFEIKNNKGEVVDTVTTNDSGEAFSKNLPYGEYTVIEVQAPVGYEKTDKVANVKIESKEKVIEIQYENNIIVGRIKIVKVDSENTDKRLAGAKFEIRDVNNNLVGTLVTDANGEAISEELVYGNYVITEVEAPTGYELGNKVIEAKVETMNQLLTYEYSNKIIKGRITIIKADDKDHAKRLSGAVFTISDKDGNVVETLTTNDNGEAVSQMLPYGEYVVEEIQAPLGYVVSKEKVDVVINVQNQEVEVFYTNKVIVGNIKVVKKDSESGKAIEGVEFIAYRKADDSVAAKAITDKKGEAIFEGLTYGEYYVKETLAAEGYILTDATFEAIVSKQDDEIVITVENDRIKGSVELLKYDAETKEPLANVEFRIVCVEGFDKGEKMSFVTNEEGLYRAENINYGVYEIVEIKAAEGYVIDENDEPIVFTINEQGQHITVEKANRRAIGEIILHKVDSETGASLAGAVFRLYDADMNKIRDIETGEDGIARFDSLPLGKYYFEEIAAPGGYLVDMDLYEFEIEEDGEIIEYEFENSKLPLLPDIEDEEEEEEIVLRPLPDTSGVNVIVVMTSVLAILGAAAMLFARKKQR